MVETNETEVGPVVLPGAGTAATVPAEGTTEGAPRAERGPRREGFREGFREGYREGGRDRDREGGRGGRDFRTRRKVCAFCVDKTKEIDYKDVPRLRRFLSERGKIEPRRRTGTCAKHQRRLSVALKRARFMALLPYTGEHLRAAERPAA